MTAPASRRHRIRSADRRTLEELGLEILEYVPNNAYLARVPREASAPLQDMLKDGDLWTITPQPPEAKISPRLTALQVTPAAGLVDVTVLFFEVPSEPQRKRLGAWMEITAWYDNPVLPHARGRLSPADLSGIASLRFVYWYAR